MKLAVIVTEFPKTTETFIARDLMVWLDEGVDLRLYHVAPWRASEILHEFAKPLAERAHHVPLGAPATLAAALRHPATALQRAGSILRHQGRDGVMAAKSLGLIPASLRLAEELNAWGATHVHAEFAGHPATMAWISHAVTGIPYSVSCRAHDIFRSQRLLAQKFGEASAVRTVSRFGATFLTKNVAGMADYDFEVIHSSVDVASIPALPPAPRDKFRLLYVGSLQPRKGVDVLLQALAGFDRPNWQLKIAGTGPDHAKLEALSKNLGLTDRVTFMGPQPYEAISGLYAESAACIAPSVIGPNGRTEGIPNVVIEAMAHARPAVSTNVSGIPELVRPSETGWLTEPGDVEGLRAALTDIHDNPERAAKIATAGRDLVAEEFDLAVNARRQLEMFRSARPRPAEGTAALAGVA
ncbi:glycosyltransferase family 4 protein [Pelagovum pacificum]|uniref:Glycosyltransferase family 4 protein n=1 Tax=Pelagovum pacificum TaxID=2588711 RepID=A0A5C5GEW9_9RHOB|nr:glycosyltransferase family 4 protein [Pelagovum pacificum]QQA43551.1 glycosyltransferase family 4 protein [Pelagovum pacificum]TNY33312.1 glycosyltransferase family 4 protein [Pelagovum pacificum]